MRTIGKPVEVKHPETAVRRVESSRVKDQVWNDGGQRSRGSNGGFEQLGGRRRRHPEAATTWSDRGERLHIARFEQLGRRRRRPEATTTSSVSATIRGENCGSDSFVRTTITVDFDLQ